MVDLDLRTHVDAAGRLVEDQDAWASHQPFGDDGLLLVAAAEPAHRLRRLAQTTRNRSLYS